MADKSDAYWIWAFTGSSDRRLGAYFIAGVDAPEGIRGTYIFYRTLKSWDDVIMRRDQTTGFDLPVFRYLKDKTKTDFVVTYAKKERRLLVTPMDSFVIDKNYGQGLQKRAKVHDSLTYERRDPLHYPTAMQNVRVRSEEPSKVLSDAFQLTEA